MLPTSNGSFIPAMPRQTDVDAIEETNPEVAQALQENQSLREQITRHNHLMQLLTHQLATPLTALGGSVHLLADVELEAAQRQEFLGIVQQQIRRLQDLLNDLIALRDLETGDFDTHPTSFCVSSLIQETIAHFAPYPILTYSAQNLPQVWGDRWQVSQVLTNLLSNAIKYSPNGQTVEIGAAIAGVDRVEIWVKDRGLGIPAADQPYLFERFYRVKHHDRENIAGTGLGLSLCKLLVENQGGEMGFESTHGQGSRFYFMLPTVERVG